MTQTNPSKREGFIQRYRLLRKAWLNSDDTEDSNNIILDLFNELDDYLDIPMGN